MVAAKHLEGAGEAVAAAAADTLTAAGAGLTDQHGYGIQKSLTRKRMLTMTPRQALRNKSGPALNAVEQRSKRNHLGHWS